jgi:hypothetical protein
MTSPKKHGFCACSHRGCLQVLSRIAPPCAFTLFSVGCGTPPLSHATNNLPFTTSIPIHDIVQRVKCELSDALDEKTEDPQFRWMQSWTAKVDLTLEVNESGGISPSLAYVQPLANGFFLNAGPNSINTVTGAQTNIASATAQNFNLGLSGTFSGDAVRTETLSFTVSLKELKKWAQDRRTAVKNGRDPGDTCLPKGINDLQGSLDLKSWLDMALAPVAAGDLKQGIHPDPGSAKQAQAGLSKAGAAAQPHALAVRRPLMAPDKKARYDRALALALTRLGINYGWTPYRPNPDIPDSTYCVFLIDQETGTAVTKFNPTTGKLVKVTLDPPASSQDPQSQGSKNTQSQGSQSTLQDAAKSSALEAQAYLAQASALSTLSPEIKSQIRQAVRLANAQSIEAERATLFAQQYICADALNNGKPVCPCVDIPGYKDAHNVDIDPKVCVDSSKTDIPPEANPKPTISAPYYPIRQLDASYCFEGPSGPDPGYRNYLRDFMKGNFAPAELNANAAAQNAAFAKSLLTPDAPIESISQSINFVVTLGAGASPTWTLVHWKGPGTNSSLASFSGIRTHTLNVALGSPSGSGILEVNRVLSNQAVRQAIQSINPQQ